MYVIMIFFRDSNHDNSSFNPKFSSLPCESSPDKMIIHALKELNIDDIQDFLKETEPPN